MPMAAFQPGSPPMGGGYPPGYGHPPGGGWSPPPQPPAHKSRTGLYFGIGCGCFFLFAAGVLGVVFVAGGAAGIATLLGPGEEVATQQVPLNQPFSLSYPQRGTQKYEAWLEVDAQYTAGYRLSGIVLLSENGSAFGQYTLDEDGDGSPVAERDVSKRINWSSTNRNGSGSARGTVALFPIPARSDGASVTLSGTISTNPGTNGTVRLFVAKRQ
jgi:hypothetical protein